MSTKCAVQQVGGGRRTVVALLWGAGSATRMPLGSVESNCADVALRRRVAAICGRLRAQQCGRYIDSPASRHAAPPAQLLILCLSPDRDRNAFNDKTQPTMAKYKLFVVFLDCYDCRTKHPLPSFIWCIDCICMLNKYTVVFILVSSIHSISYSI